MHAFAARWRFSPTPPASLKNMTDLVDAASRYGIGVMGVVAVGRAMARNAQYFRLATRIMAELGANVVKCYYTEEGFDTITSCCPVPIVIAGGKKLFVVSGAPGCGKSRFALELARRIGRDQRHGGRYRADSRRL